GTGDSAPQTQCPVPNGQCLPMPTAAPDFDAPDFDERVAARKRRSLVLAAALFLATLFGILVLVTLLVDVFLKGLPWLDLGFLDSYPSRIPERAGIKSALVGSLWVMGLTALLAVPVGVASAVFLEEYAPRSWIFRAIQVNIANLAGVPSVLYGILGLALFVRFFGLGRSLLAGSITMALLVLPVLIIATQEALRAVPSGLRESAYALG